MSLLICPVRTINELHDLRGQFASSSPIPELFRGQEPQTQGSEACTPVPVHSCLVISQAQNILAILCVCHPLEWTVSSWMLDPCMIQKSNGVSHCRSHKTVMRKTVPLSDPKSDWTQPRVGQGIHLEDSHGKFLTRHETVGSGRKWGTECAGSA